MRYRIIIFAAVGVIILVGALAFLFGRKGGGGGEAVTINFWGTDKPEIWAGIITAYQTANPLVVINYAQKSASGYEKELLNALASGAGPDIVEINNTWLNKHIGKLSPMPGGLMTLQSFFNDFAEVASGDLLRDNQIYALPFYIDTLALYYNRSLYNNVGLINPPKTWDDFNQTVKTLSQTDESGSIVRSGAALGTAGNVNYASDILTLLMMQTGAVMVGADGSKATFDQTANLEGRVYSPGQAALDFYTGFANVSKPVYSWNARLPNSLAAFVKGQTAMYLGYAHDLSTIRGSGLNFVAAPAPQIKDSKKDASYLDINFASYQAGAVTRASPNKTAAWNFLVFAASRNAAGSYLAASYLPPARKDLIEFTATDPQLNVFARQTLTAAAWPQPDDAEVKKIFERMITSVALGQSTSAEAIKEAAIEVTNLLK